MIPSTNLDTLQDAIKDALAAKFPGVTVDFYPRPGERIPTPAIYLEIEDIPSADPDACETEQTEVIINFNAYCVLDYKTGSKKALRTFAAGVLAYVRGKRWGQAVQAAKSVGAFPDRINGQDRDYECMRVEFYHEGLLGDDVWVSDDPLPTEVWLGYAPNIGPDHIDDYQLVTELPPEGPIT